MPGWIEQVARFNPVNWGMRGTQRCDHRRRMGA
jgi:hypothetical protein